MGAEKLDEENPRKKGFIQTVVEVPAYAHRTSNKRSRRSRRTPTVRRTRSDTNYNFESGIPRAVGWRRCVDFVADDLGYMN